MKKILSVLLVIALAAACFAGCGAKKEEPAPEVEANTVGTKIQQVFDNSSETEVSKVVDELVAAASEITGADIVPMDVEAGWLNGITVDVDGFSEGMMFSPMIGSIPFVGYVLKADDAEAVKTVLTENADMAWNICTEADEMVASVRDGLVFFVMCSNEN